eukprot:TRINITY_DN8324_c0_g1_i1.p1 TRINITY_DN8324_c0_g1~~TRINITY_DN8324_c0_g1_i1.p1  ORF type:complete len:419 (+),score=77.21 TRINITY_DN8324_c0_g1_i1:47-1303(+)
MCIRDSLLLHVREQIDDTPRGEVFHYPAVHPAEMPPLDFHFTYLICNNNQPQRGDTSLQTKFRYPKRSPQDLLSKVISEYMGLTDTNRKTIIRIGVVGGDSALHNLINAYSSLRSIRAFADLDHLDIQFFLVPVENSAFATFLANYDGWYQRNVYCLNKAILRTYPVNIPTPTETAMMIKSAIQSDGATLGPIHNINMPYGVTPWGILWNEAQNFFREARYRLDVWVYHCECWGEDSVYFSIPFCQRAEIGVRSYARSVQKQVMEPTTFSSIQNHKLFKWQPNMLSIRCTQVNVLGTPRPGLSLEPKSYVSLLMANIPLQGDRGIPANPSKSWLEMTLIEVDKKKKNPRLEKDLAEGPCSTLHTSVVEIEVPDRKNGSFHILLDNVLYGPFVKVKISPCNDEEITVPFMTFFPIDLPS